MKKRKGKTERGIEKKRKEEMSKTYKQNMKGIWPKE